MNCDLCGSDPDLVILSPIRLHTGSLCAMTCLHCAVASGTYCLRHETPHLSFGDGSHACRECIEELVSGVGDSLQGYIADILQGLPLVEYEALMGWARTSAVVTSNSWKVCIFRVIATRSLRRSMSLMEVMREVVASQSVATLLRE